MDNIQNLENVFDVRIKSTCNTVVYRTVASNGTCDSVRRVIAYLGFGFQAGHLFILFILLFLITASPFGC